MLAAVLVGLLTGIALPLLAPTPSAVATDEALDQALEVVEGTAQGTAGSTPAGDEPELTLALRDLWLARGELTGAEQRQARALLSRPSDDRAHEAWRYPADVERLRTCSARVCVTHVGVGQHRAAPAWASATLGAFEASWSRVVDGLGYRPPAADGTRGGDARFDVYLADLSSQRGLYGYCAAEELVPGQAARATAFCVLDNDMADLGPRPRDALSATAAHEFFHAVQFNYDVAEDVWFMESSATWAEGQVFPGLRDNRQFLPHGQLGRPTTPLDSHAGRYGNWIFVQYLAQTGGVDAVRRVWERLDASAGARDEWSLLAVRRHFAARGVAWPRLYADFARANFRPGRHYADGDGLPRARAGVTDRVTLRKRRPTTTRTAWLPHLSSHTLRLRVGHLDRGHRRMRLDLRATRKAHARVQLLVHRRDGRVVHRRVTLGAQGRATVRVTLRPRRVRHVVVLTSHSGAAHRNCGSNSGWACGGDPVGDLRVRVRARLR